METATAQILYLDAPDHAAVDIAVNLIRREPQGHRFTQVANAVLRRIAREAHLVGAEDDPLRDNLPGWLADRLEQDYGAETARAIAKAHLAEPALDLTVKADADAWAARLDAIVLPGGTIRLRGRTPVQELDGYGRATGGCRMRPRPFPPGCSRSSPASAWPISAPRPAARRPSSAPPAGGSPRSTARPSGSPGWKATWRGSPSRPKPSSPMPSASTPSPSTPCCSTRPARRPARSGAIRKWPGSSSRRTR